MYSFINYYASIVHAKSLKREINSSIRKTNTSVNVVFKLDLSEIIYFFFFFDVFIGSTPPPTTHMEIIKI